MTTFQEDDDEETNDPTFNVFVPHPNIPILTETIPETEIVEENGNLAISREPEINLDTVEESVIGPEVDSLAWRRLGNAICPNRLFSRRTKWYARIWELICLPYFIVFTLTIPIVDSEDQEGEGDDGDSGQQEIENDKSWSQYLHVIQVNVVQIKTLEFSVKVTNLWNISIPKNYCKQLNLYAGYFGATICRFRHRVRVRGSSR